MSQLGREPVHTNNSTIAHLSRQVNTSLASIRHRATASTLGNAAAGNSDRVTPNDQGV